MKRVFLFIVTNIAVLAVLYVLLPYFVYQMHQTLGRMETAVDARLATSPRAG